jgi:hypothetical protein
MVSLIPAERVCGQYPSLRFRQDLLNWLYFGIIMNG